MQKIKKIGPLSLAKILAVTYAIMGLIAGIFFSGMSNLVSFFSSGEAESFSSMFGLGAIIILPILYGAIGFVGGLVMAWLYNLIAAKIGGIEIELE